MLKERNSKASSMPVNRRTLNSSTMEPDSDVRVQIQDIIDELKSESGFHHF